MSCLKSYFAMFNASFKFGGIFNFEQRVAQDESWHQLIFKSEIIYEKAQFLFLSCFYEQIA